MTGIELEPVDFFCPYCDSAMEWTTCDAPLCTGYRCLNCAAGCDLYQQPEHGRCAQMLLTMSPAVAADRRDDRRLSHRFRRPITLPRGECS